MKRRISSAHSLTNIKPRRTIFFLHLSSSPPAGAAVAAAAAAAADDAGATRGLEVAKARHLLELQEAPLQCSFLLVPFPLESKHVKDLTNVVFGAINWALEAGDGRRAEGEGAGRKKERRRQSVETRVALGGISKGN